MMPSHSVRRDTHPIRRCLFAAVVLLLKWVQVQGATHEVPEAGASHAPVNIIFDTDMWSDIDDALALAMLHTLEDRGEVKLLAVTIATNDRWSDSYVSLLNTFYGRAQLPIGSNHKCMDREYFRKLFEPYPAMRITRYTQRLSERRNEDGSLRYPHGLRETRAPEATTLLRKTLAAQPDGSVVMIQVGYSANFARLLDSPADAISGLDGRALVAKKVRLLSLMAGNFGETMVRGQAQPKGAREFNLVADVPSAQKLFAKWPTPIVASGFEVGLSISYPRESILNDFRYAKLHPIEETYSSYCVEQKDQIGVEVCPHGHPTFDLTSVLYAVRPNGNYFSLSNPGHIVVLDDGRSEFKEAPDGRDRYLILDEAQRARTLEAMVMLVSQPPRHIAGR